MGAAFPSRDVSFQNLCTQVYETACEYWRDLNRDALVQEMSRRVSLHPSQSPQQRRARIKEEIGSLPLHWAVDAPNIEVLVAEALQT